MITALIGSNAYLRAEKIRSIKSEFQKNYGNEGIEQYHAEQVKPDELTSLLTAASLFATNRLVIISELSSQKAAAETFLDVIEKIPEEIHVVLIESQPDKRTVYYKTLQKKAEVILCNELDEASLQKWLKSYVAAEKGKIDQADVRLLLQYVGFDQLRLKHEVDKLLSYDADITAKTIKELIEPQPQDTIFQLLEYAISGKTNQALQVLTGLERAHEDPYQTASMLVWQTQILAIVTSAGAPAEPQIAKEAKINPFVIKKTKALSNKLSKQKVENIIDAVALLDVELKSTSVDPWRLIEATLLQL